VCRAFYLHIIRALKIKLCTSEVLFGGGKISVNSFREYHKPQKVQEPLLQCTIPTCCERVEGTGEALLSALVKRPSDMEYATLAKPPSLPVAKLVGAWKPIS
jgi:hypothetical protein